MAYFKRLIALAVALFVVSAAIAGCGGKDGDLNEAVATVNGNKITGRDLVNRLNIFELFFKQPMDDPATKAQILDQMVRERLIIAQAGPMGISIEPAQVEAEMTKFFAALERQYSSAEEVDKVVKDLGLTNDMIASFLNDFLLAQAVVDKQKAAVTVTEEELRAFYEQNKESLYTFSADVVRASHVLLPPDQEEKAKEIAAKAKNGEDFAALAREYSTDPGSAHQGGDLGYFTQEKMVPEFATAAFSLQPGSVSDPVRSSFGWHVIKVEDRKGPGTLTYEEAASDVRNRLLPQKQNEAVEAWIKEMENGATISKVEISS